MPQLHGRGARQRTSAHGRGLFERGIEHMATHSKLWLFGVPRKRLIVLDSDMVVLGPLDWVTRLPLPSGHVAAMGFGGRDRDGAMSHRFFNSGLMALQPAAADLHNLTRLAVQARLGTVPAIEGQTGQTNGTSIARAGEKQFGDQSLLNHYFRSRWKPLPAGMVGVAPAKVGIHGERILAADPAVVHWLSEPKPWSTKSLGHIQSDAAGRPAARRGPMSSQAALWWQLCRAHLSGVPPFLMG